MRDSNDPTSSDPNLAILLQNCFPVDSDRNSAVIGRPGVRVLDRADNSGYGQRSHQLTKLSGAEISLCVIGGEIYTINWPLRTLTKQITISDLAANGIGLNTSGRVYCLTFADAVTISDGTHQPFQWDGTPGGGLTLLSAAHAGGWYGQPTVYYGKQFGIRRLERGTLEWSEENQPNVGYESGGFLNVWTLGQTSQDPLFLLIGTNEQLGVFRSRSATAIGGAVTEDFTSSGTREALSSTVGTESPASAVFLNASQHDVAGDRVYFMDADLRPHVWVPGAGVLAAHSDFADTIRGLERARRDLAISVFDPMTNRVYMGASEIGDNTSCTMQLGLAPRGKNEASCIIRGYDFTSLDVLKDHKGRPTVVHLTDDGYVLDHGQLDGDLDEQFWDDLLPQGKRAISHAIASPVLGFDEYMEKFFSRIDFSLRSPNNLNNCALTTEASHVRGPVQQFDVRDAGFSQWDIAVWDQAVWGGATGIEHHISLGLKVWGRWCTWRLQHEALAEQFGYIRSQLIAHARAPNPKVP